MSGNNNPGASNNVKIPKYAFAIDTKKISSLATTAKDAKTIEKLFSAVYRPYTCSTKPQQKDALNPSDYRSFKQLMELQTSLKATCLNLIQDINDPGAIFTNYASSEITVFIRQRCFQWLIDVSLSRNADPNVVFHAMVLFDRVMVLTPLPKQSCQLIAATSYFIASKIREAQHISAWDLHDLTSNTFTEQEILDCECYVLMVLDFNVDCVTPIQFLQTMASCLLSTDLVGLMVQKTTDVLNNCVANEQLSAVPASVLAASALIYTMSSLAVGSEFENVFTIGLGVLSDILNVKMEVLCNITNTIKDILTTNSLSNNNNSSLTHHLTANVTPPPPPPPKTASAAELDQSSPVAPQEVQFLL